LADRHDLRIHVDGARLFNAADVLNLEPKALVADADSVQVCFSKVFIMIIYI
jgi:threonine aldolase